MSTNNMQEAIRGGDAVDVDHHVSDFIRNLEQAPGASFRAAHLAVLKRRADIEQEAVSLEIESKLMKDEKAALESEMARLNEELASNRDKIEKMPQFFANHIKYGS